MNEPLILEKKIDMQLTCGRWTNYYWTQVRNLVMPSARTTLPFTFYAKNQHG